MVYSKELCFVADVRTESKTDCLTRTAKTKGESTTEQCEDRAETNYMDTMVEYMEYEDFGRCRTMGLSDCG